MSESQFASADGAPCFTAQCEPLSMPFARVWCMWRCLAAGGSTAPRSKALRLGPWFSPSCRRRPSNLQVPDGAAASLLQQGTSETPPQGCHSLRALSALLGVCSVVLSAGLCGCHLMVSVPISFCLGISPPFPLKLRQAQPRWALPFFDIS